MELLKKLSDASGVSGREEAVRNIIIEELEKSNLNYNIDKMGNVIVKKGNGTKKLMISAHMDEVGFIATYSDSKGFLRIANVGDINIENLNGELINFPNAACKIVNSKAEKDINSIFVDILDENKFVKIGDTAAFQPKYMESRDKISGKALSSRALCYILLELAKKSDPKDYTVYFVFTVQNELKGRGARTAAWEIVPDYSIVLEGENSNDFLGGEENISLNNGPALRIMDKVLIMHKEVQDIIEIAAEKSDISVQKTVSNELSEGGSIHKELSGIKTGVLALPVRYKHSSLEIIGRRDLEDLKNILLNILE